MKEIIKTILEIALFIVLSYTLNYIDNGFKHSNNISVFSKVEK